MRFERHTWRGALVVNDAYNANPESMRAALETFAAMPVRGRRFLVVGEMRELGAHSREAHREVGRLVARDGFDRLIATGGDARFVVEAAVEHGLPPERASEPAGVEEAAALLREELRPGDAVLIKGSRANRLERIVEDLLASGEGQTRPTARCT
jgi:UDP-N-acetylmuramoyl-tripeptide--D-alanyl-D-alanine ligase